jgi:hypothetical protein
MDLSQQLPEKTVLAAKMMRGQSAAVTGGFTDGFQGCAFDTLGVEQGDGGINHARSSQCAALSLGAGKFDGV